MKLKAKTYTNREEEFDSALNDLGLLGLLEDSLAAQASLNKFWTEQKNLQAKIDAAQRDLEMSNAKLGAIAKHLNRPLVIRLRDSHFVAVIAPANHSYVTEVAPVIASVSADK